MSSQLVSKLDPQRLAEEVEHLEYENDVLAARLACYETVNEEFIPGELVDRFDAGEIPTRVWREYRGISVAELADSAGLTGEELSRLEAGQWEPGLRVMARIARALRVDVDELVPWPQGDDEAK
jgi:DNA-binding XRE family transcriptional regulator